MSRRSLEGAVPAGDRVLIDASALIAYLNGGEAGSPAASHVINSWIRPGRNLGIVSMVSVMEVLVQPLRAGPGPYQTALDFLTHFPNLQVHPVTLQVAQEAASLRATYHFRPPDALTIGTGIAAQVGHLICNDEAWMRLKPIETRIRVCYLGNHLPFR